ATLTRGNLADLILIDLAAPNMQPSGQEVRNLVYSCGRSNVLMTVIGGKIVYRNGEYNIGDSPERILSRCKLRAKKLLS
ncbi:MAG: amidohydrolase, partial [Lachnospiraceae bacterium]|nr:amidohydrolase [Lachnospiraceae bacterium]